MVCSGKHTEKLTGRTVWLFGLSGAGKSTLAEALAGRLNDADCSGPVLLLDGDSLRKDLNHDLGFDRDSRYQSTFRTACVARRAAQAGCTVIVSLVSPYIDDRLKARRLHSDWGIPYFEIHVNTPLEVCEQRDVKGLYKAAREGRIQSMTGINDTFEIGATADLTLDTVNFKERELVKMILDLVS